MAGGLSVLIAFANTALAPYKPLAGWVVLVAGAALLVSLTTLVPASRLAGVPKLAGLSQEGQQRLGAWWGIQMVAAFALVTALAAAFAIGLPTPDDPAKALQNIAPTPSISANPSVGATPSASPTPSISANPSAAATAQVGATPDGKTDPRRELASLGVTWSTDAFIEALETSDARTVQLFLDGGMSPTVLHKGTAAVLYILQPGLPDALPMLKLLVAAGFDPNSFVVDGRIFAGYGDTLDTFPPFFISDDLPHGGLSSSTNFEGPALLWVVVRASYFGPTSSDLSVIKYLMEQGADTKIAKQFLDAYRSCWDEFPAFQQTSKAVYGVDGAQGSSAPPVCQ